MSAHLLIRDGSPSWLSPDIWVVPGTDPHGAPGTPQAGLDARLWARVTNIGQQAANGVRVDFYQAAPSAHMVAGVASFIGSGFADLAAGETKEVMCQVPWRPAALGAARECVLAVAHGGGDSDPIPDPLPNGYPFRSAGHDQAAQLNLTVIDTCREPARLTLFVNPLGRAGKLVTVSLEFGGDLDARVLDNLGLHALRRATQHHVWATLSRDGGCAAGQGDLALDVAIERSAPVPVFAWLQVRSLPRGQYQLVHVVERGAGKLLGGVSYLVVNRG